MVAFFTVCATEQGGADRVVLRAFGALWLYAGLVPMLWNWVVHPIPETALTLRLAVPALLATTYFLLVGKMQRWVVAE